MQQYIHTKKKGACVSGRWYGKCYHHHKDDTFPVLALGDLDYTIVDKSNMADDDPKYFQDGHDRDHMLVQFHCNPCQFFKMKKQLPCI